LRKDWASEQEHEAGLDAVAMYYTAMPKDGQVIDDQTWQDLAMDDVFRKIDRAVAMPGRQVLYARLRFYEAREEELAERSRQYSIFRKEIGLREQIQLQLCRLRVSGMEWVAPLILNPFPRRPKYVWLLYVLSIASFLCLLGIALYGGLVVPALLLVLVNAVTHVSLSRNLGPYFRGFSKIARLLAVAESLSKVKGSEGLPQSGYLRGVRDKITLLRRRLAWFTVDRQSASDLTQAIFEYLNVFFLFDLQLYFRSLPKLEEHRATLIRIFDAVGSIDAAMATASYVEGLKLCSTPRLIAARRLETVEMYHPLVRDAVSNSISLDARSVLIAGPNMAGKTTFIRTIGINLILAQTLNICLARSGVFPRAVVRSAIRREDNLLEGESYFYTEISRIFEFIKEGDNGSLCVFLIDEIYRGTNTVERIAASASVLRYLAQRQIVLATTHDQELQGLLIDACEMYHFDDRVLDGQYGFDYHLRSGPVYSRNAIKLLELSGYPEAITAEATAMADRLDASQKKLDQLKN
jgi:hypothetical protein